MESPSIVATKKTNIQRFYTIKDETYNLPSHSQQIYDENIISIIEQWPSYCSRKTVAENQIFCHKGRMKVLDVALSKFPKNLPKPKLLQCMDNYIKGEMKKHGIDKNSDSPVRLQIYREVFEWLIDSFKTYQPLLSRIKQEYEITLTRLREEIRKLEPMKEVLWTIAEERDQQLLQLKQEENLTIKMLRNEIENKLKEMSAKDANAELLQSEVDRLRKELQSEHRLLMHETDARKLLIIDINDLKAHIEDMVRLRKERDVRGEIEDPILMRMALEEAKKSHDHVVRELVELTAYYYDYVPAHKHDRLTSMYNSLITEHKSHIEAINHLNKELDDLNEKYNYLLQQRDFYYLKYMESAQTGMHPTVNIGGVESVIADGMERWHDLAGHQTDLINTTILEELKDVTDINHIFIKDSKISVEAPASVSRPAEVSPMRTTHSPSTHESKAIIRTIVEMMCELPAGSISPKFDPMALLPILNKERARRESYVQEQSNKKLNKNITSK